MTPILQPEHPPGSLPLPDALVAAGMDDFVRKPYRAEEYTAIVQAVQASGGGQGRLQ